MAFIGMYQTMTKKAAITVQVGTGLCHSAELCLGPACCCQSPQRTSLG